MSAMWRKLIFALVALAALAGCREKQRTALVVEVDSNLAVPGGLDKIDIAVTANGKTQHMPYSLIGGNTLPLRTALVETTESVGTIDVVATGLLGTTTVVAEQASISFLAGQTRLLKLFLAAECRANPCTDPTQTCTKNGACIDKVRPPSSLAPFDPKAIRDAGADTGSVGPEVGLRDAGFADAGPEATDAPLAGELPPDSRADLPAAPDIVAASDWPDAVLDWPDAVSDVSPDAAPDVSPDVRQPDLLSPPDLLVTADANSTPDKAVPADAPIDVVVTTDVVPDAGTAVVDVARDEGGALARDAGADLNPDARRAGSLTMIAAGYDHSCGIRRDGSVLCWGQNDVGQAAAAVGPFIQVAGGRGHTCGLKADGAIECWGDNQYGQLTPAPGTYKQISLGWYHTCGLKTDDSIACWGNDDYRQTRAEAGPFTQVAAGSMYTCGLRPGCGR
jgi:hypothetical protein